MVVVVGVVVVVVEIFNASADIVIVLDRMSAKKPIDQKIVCKSPPDTTYISKSRREEKLFGYTLRSNRRLSNSKNSIVKKTAFLPAGISKLLAFRLK